MSFEIHLGRLWVHRNLSPYQQLPMYTLNPTDDIHGELSFYLDGERIPGLGYITYDQHARVGACLIEWCDYLRSLDQAFMQDPLDYRFCEYDLTDHVYHFVNEGDTIYLSVETPGGSPLPGWEVRCFDHGDFIDQYRQFIENFQVQILNVNPRALVHWLPRF